jgi:putative flippase GtrA
MKFDLEHALEKFAYRIHPKIGNYYKAHPTIQQYIKFSLVALVFGYLLNIPLVIFFTELFHLWYGLSIFLAAFIINTFKFLWNKLWVFRR